MVKNLIDVEYTPQELSDIDMHQEGILAIIIPKSVNLTKLQRKLPHAAADRKVYCTKSVIVVEANPNLLPPTGTIEKMKRDMLLDRQIEPAREKNAKITELLTDSQIAAQTDAFTFLLDVYRSAQNQAELGVPGMDSIVADLGKLFKKQGRKKPPTA